MRLILKLSPSNYAVPFDYHHVLTGVLHRWLGPNPEHDGLSLYSFSNLHGGQRDGTRLDFRRGGTWMVSSHDEGFLRRSVNGILTDPELNWGMRVQDVTLQAPPAFEDGKVQRFMLSSPVFIKRSEPDPTRPEGKNDRFYLYTDPESDHLLTDTMRHKLRVAGLPEAGLEIRFDRDYPRAKTKMIIYKGYKRKCSECPVWIKGSSEQLAFAWSVGVGNNTGSGFGGVW